MPTPTRLNTTAAAAAAGPLMFTVVVELDIPVPDDAGITTITDAIADFSGCLSSNPTTSGATCLITLSVPGVDVRQAIAVALAVTDPFGPAVGVEALREDLSDTRAGFAPIPALVSVAEAAQMLDVTRPTVHAMHRSGALHGNKVGGTLVLTDASVRALARTRAQERSHKAS